MVRDCGKNEISDLLAVMNDTIVGKVVGEGVLTHINTDLNKQEYENL